MTARGWGELGGDKCKRASAAGLIDQRNGCASKVKVNPPTPEHKGRGKEKPCCFLVPGSSLDLIPENCAHILGVEGDNNQFSAWTNTAKTTHRDRLETQISDDSRGEKVQILKSFHDLFFPLFLNFSFDFSIQPCCFLSFKIRLRHFVPSWQTERDIPGIQNLPYFDQSVAYGYQKSFAYLTLLCR